MKRCSWCEQMKPLDAFYKNKTQPFGRHCACVECEVQRKEELSRTKPSVAKICPRCKTLKQVSDYSTSSSTSDGLLCWCRDCMRWSRIKRVYGITKEQFEKMLHEQKGVCAICQQPDVDGLNVDHCHDAKHTRGLLCNNCNLALGYLKDNPNTLLAAIEYLNKHQPP